MKQIYMTVVQYPDEITRMDKISIALFQPELRISGNFWACMHSVFKDRKYQNSGLVAQLKRFITRLGHACPKFAGIPAKKGSEKCPSV